MVTNEETKLDNNGERKAEEKEEKKVKRNVKKKILTLLGRVRSVSYPS